MRGKSVLEYMRIVGDIPEAYVGEKNYVSTGAVSCDHINPDAIEKYAYSALPSRANLTANAGDILFAKMKGTKKTLLLDAETENNIYSTGFFAVRAREEHITNEMLYHLLGSEYFLTQKDQYASGATQQAVTNEGLKQVYVTVPPYEKQATGARCLTLLENLIAKRQEQLKTFDMLVKARFVEMFGDPVLNPMGWEEIKLGERCEIITGNTPPRADKENYGASIEWIKSDNINTPSVYLTKAVEYLSDIGLKKGRKVENGSILMTCIAGSINCIGNVAVADRAVAFNQQINAIVPGEDEPLYLYALILLSKPLIHSKTNLMLKGILSKNKLSEIIFPFPPLSIQKDFSTFVSHIESLKSPIRASLSELTTLKKSLLQEYFT